MEYVYILESIMKPDHFYIGQTSNLKRRIAQHNAGESIHTNKYKPWRIKTYLAFDNLTKAKAFEAFLKTGNGRLFAKKRL